MRFFCSSELLHQFYISVGGNFMFRVREEHVSLSAVCLGWICVTWIKNRINVNVHVS